MKSVLFCLLLSFFKPAFAQEWPWFFSETAFKSWLVEKNVKCLKYVSNDLPYSDMISNKNWPAIKKGITSYYFDDAGLLQNVKVEEIQISVYPDSLKTEKNYYLIINKLLASMPWEMQESDKIKLYEYDKSKLFPGIKSNFSGRAIAPDGTVFADYSHVDESSTLFPFSYNYRLNQEIHLDGGEIVSLQNYYLSDDYCCNHIPSMGVVAYTEINDSVSVLNTKSHSIFLGDYSFVGRDTIIYHSYYCKKTPDKKREEYGVRLKDSSGTYCYLPLMEIIIDETANEKIQYISHLKDRSYLYPSIPLPIFTGIEDYKYLSYGSFAVLYDDWVRRSCDNLFDHEYHTEKIKIVSTFDKKTGEIHTKKICEWENDEWKLTMSETKTPTGYLQKHFYNGKKNYSHLIKINMDEHGNPEFLRETNYGQEVIFRISGDSIYLTEKENEYGTFLIEYE